MVDGLQMRSAILLLFVGCACAQTAPPINWVGVPRPADIAVGRPLNVGFVIVDGVYNTELTAPFDIFQHTVFHTKPLPGMKVFTVSPNGEMVTSFEGLKIGADYSFADAPKIDVLVVPSAEHSMDSDLQNKQLIDWVTKTGTTASFVMSLCDGAFVLAKAGLLKGRSSTTFPSDQARYQQMFPELDVRTDVSFVHDGPALTSEGGAKSFDVAMYLVEHLYGVDVAKRVGRGLIISWPPAPGTMPAVVVKQRDEAKPQP